MGAYSALLLQLLRVPVCNGAFGGVGPERADHLRGTACRGSLSALPEQRLVSLVYRSTARCRGRYDHARPHPGGDGYLRPPAGRTRSSKLGIALLISDSPDWFAY